MTTSANTFHEALNLAITRSGLSLENIQRRLAERRIAVSLASLSYWRRGRTRPERRTSLVAVAALEEILDLPHGALRSLLAGPARVPGEEWAMRASAFEQVLTGAERPGLSAESNNELAAVSIEADLVFGPHREKVRHTNRRLLMALSDGPVRYITRYAIDPGEELPVLGQVTGAAPGQRLRDVEHGISCAELVFDRPQPRGETQYLEWHWEFPHGIGDYRHSEVVVSTSCRTLCYRLFFHPEAIPARCYRTFRTSMDVPEERVAELRVGPRGSTHFLLTDVPSGWYGVTWEWD
ncbi:hypothetical protein JOF53_002219 [Crossiella equi]|uniref:XRE family transcriptional regulator n=1 Tax=Crossiella equi TaxID=130796 RepID=A0ABS5A9T2_9PSEU|nr:hypothetical protein [Crossiella equi]MBP2473347.1 hypothetical protein [Crossiella equi]